MARRALRLEVALAWLCLVPACSSTRAITYFTLDPLDTSQAQAAEKLTDGAADSGGTQGEPLVIQVDRFRALDIYDEPRIAFGDGPRLDHFKYCRWAAPPPKMLEDVVIRALRKNGNSVERYSESHSESGVLLQCELRHILIQGAGQGLWQAVLRAEVRLLKLKDGAWAQVGFIIYLDARGEDSAPDGEEGAVTAIQRAVAKLVEDLDARCERLETDIRAELARR